MSRILFIFLFLFFGKVSAINPDDLLGTWMSTDNSVKVEVYLVNTLRKHRMLRDILVMVRLIFSCKERLCRKII